MRGFQICYRNGEQQTVNSVDGDLSGTVEFNQGDELVGITVKVTTESDKRPRLIGFTLMR